MIKIEINVVLLNERMYMEVDEDITVYMLLQFISDVLYSKKLIIEERKDGILVNGSTGKIMPLDAKLISLGICNGSNILYLFREIGPDNNTGG